MKLFDVYPLLPIRIVKAENCMLWDEKGIPYLDFYGGHAVVSIGHSHPHYVERIQKQISRIGFYSNSIENPLQEELASKLGQVSGYETYQLFLCNSGAEANENAFKVASFFTGKKKFITFNGGFHGRTSAAVGATDDPSIIAPVNETDNFIFCEFNNVSQFTELFENHNHELAGVILEGIQGIGGIRIPSAEFMATIQKSCSDSEVLFISDEIQSGYGRSGKFFAHQHFNCQPDLITVAKGMGNGFPIGGVLISPKIPAKRKMLGTTFGGNHLGCAAALAVLEVMEKENLTPHALRLGNYLIEQLRKIPQIHQVRGQGLMIAIDFETSASSVSKILRDEHRILVGSAANPNTMRLLPPLSITQLEVDYFLHSLKQTLQ